MSKSCINCTYFHDDPQSREMNDMCDLGYDTVADVSDDRDIDVLEACEEWEGR